MHREVVGRNQEVEVPGQALLEGAVESSRHLGDRSAALAHQVKVVLVGEVVDGWPMPEVSVLNDALPLEDIQGPVHGRRGDLGMLTVDALGEFLGGHVAGAVQQGRDDDPALDGGPPAVGAEGGQDGLQAGIGTVRRAYSEAIAHRYFFYSYGDCMFLDERIR